MTLDKEILDKMDQKSLIELFFDWYDWYNEYQFQESLLNLRELRSRIKIYTTTGIKDSKK